MLVVVSHDAGGAHLLSSYLEKSEQQAVLVLQGPAEKVFFETLGRTSDAPNVEAVGQSISRMLTGSSWESNLEWGALRFAKDRGIFSSTFLDHWVNYRRRFTRNGIEVLPNQIWVGDGTALKMASSEFPGTPVLHVANPYLKKAKSARWRLPKVGFKSKKLRVLYACEPTEEWDSYTELEALIFFLRNLDTLEAGSPTVTIRPHPSEPNQKYHNSLRQFPFVKFGGSMPLIDELKEHDVVVGRHTMALVVGAEMGLRAISAIPPGGGVCQLPSDQVEDFRALIIPVEGQI